MDKETGEALEIDGETVTSELTFTPESTEGTVDCGVHFQRHGSGEVRHWLFLSPCIMGRKKSLPTRISIHRSRRCSAFCQAPLQQIRAWKPDRACKGGSIHYGYSRIYEPHCRGNLHDPRYADGSGNGEELLIDDKPVTAEAENLPPEETSGTTELTFTLMQRHWPANPGGLRGNPL